MPFLCADRMGQVMAKPERIVFEYGYGARIASAFVALLMWALVLASLAGAIYLLVQGAALAATIACAIGLVLAPLTIGHQHMMRLKHKWHLSLRPGHVMLVLPAHRAAHHKTEGFEGEINYRSIKGICRRRETHSVLGLRMTVMAYWLELQDGRMMLLGEDRNPGNHENGRKTVVARASEAVSRTSGLPLRRAEPANTDRRFFGLIGSGAPSWTQDA